MSNILLIVLFNIIIHTILLTEVFFKLIMNKKQIIIPKISVLEVQLIINKYLFTERIISETQYNEVYKIIYEKIHQLKKQNQEA